MTANAREARIIRVNLKTAAGVGHSTTLNSAVRPLRKFAMDSSSSEDRAAPIVEISSSSSGFGSDRAEKSGEKISEFRSVRVDRVGRAGGGMSFSNSVSWSSCWEFSSRSWNFGIMVGVVRAFRVFECSLLRREMRG